ncbi:MAG TPA: YoaK family protein [Solirubrobacteraceae bacterium]|nr:YoaK family protein [Solirubrobacteraceae bacterium]
MSAVPSRPGAGPPGSPGSPGSEGPAGPAAGVSSLRHPLTRALLLLTLTTGLVDAASYLGLGHVFSANMTGNVVLLGFGLVGSGGLPVIGPVVSLVAFLAGAGAGGQLARALGDNRRRHLLTALAIEAVVVLVAAVWTAAVAVRADGFSGDLVIGLLALGMGVRSATVRRLAVPDLTTTVLTMTLTGMAADSQLFGGSGAGTSRRAAAVVAMLVGAVIGALLLKASLTFVLVVAGGLTAATLVAYGGLVGSD